MGVQYVSLHQISNGVSIDHPRGTFNGPWKLRRLAPQAAQITTTSGA
jgi:hypothetical protein